MQDNESYDIFRAYVNTKVKMSDEEFEQVKKMSSIKRLRHHQYLLQEGDVAKFTGLVTKGCLRNYTVDAKANEHIIYFAIENWWTGDRGSFLSQEPTKYNIDAVEDTELVYFTKANFEQLCNELPIFNEMINTILHKSFVVNQTRIHEAISLTAEEKYLNFMAKYPNLANRIPQHMIASYLGMKPETLLSRIRKTSIGKLP